MAFPIITAEDFVGNLNLPKGTFDTERLGAFITQFQNKYWIDLIGAEAFALVSSLTNLSPKWVDLLETDFLVYSNKKMGFYVNQYSAKSLLLQFIYFHFVSDLAHSTVEPTGVVRGRAENSELTTIVQGVARATNRYNSAVINYHDYFCPFVNAYKIREMEVISSVIGGGETTFTVNSTKYLEVGDSVVISEAAYEVLAVISDIEFTISGEVNGAKAITYSPFEVVSLSENLNVITL